MKPIEIRGCAREKNKSVYIYYGIGLLGFLNLHAMPLFAVCAWAAIWCGIGFLAQSSTRARLANFCVRLDDSGVTLTDGSKPVCFSWDDLRVQEITKYVKSHTNNVGPFSELGRDVKTHGGSGGVIEESVGASENWKLLIGYHMDHYLSLKSESSGESVRIDEKLISKGDMQDLIGIFNIRVASRSQSVIKTDMLDHALGAMKTVDRAKLRELAQEAKQLRLQGEPESLSVYETMVAAARQNSSPLGFSKLHVLEGYMQCLRKHEDIEKAKQIEQEIQAIRSIAL